MKILVKRIYEPAARSDGFRVLVDRLWPRGISRSDAKLDLWLPDIRPSTALRQWLTMILPDERNSARGARPRRRVSKAPSSPVRAKPSLTPLNQINTSLP